MTPAEAFKKSNHLEVMVNLEINRKHSRLLEYKEIILNIKINEKLQKSSISNNNNNSKKKLNDIIDKIFSDLKKHKEKYKKIQNFKMKPYNAYYLRNHIAEIIGSLEKYDKDLEEKKNEN